MKKMKLRDRKARKGMFGPAAFLWEESVAGNKVNDPEREVPVLCQRFGL